MTQTEICHAKQVEMIQILGFTSRSFPKSHWLY